MRVITKPTVTIISRPTFAGHPEYSVPDDGDDVTRLCAFAAKGCYDSYGKDGRPCRDNQRAILDHQHYSVIEHAHIGVFIEGISRACSMELNRHRTFNISQRSTRYTDEGDAAIVFGPYYSGLYNSMLGDNGSMTPTKRRLITTALTTAESSLRSYAQQVKLLTELNPNDLDGPELRKWARGIARDSLPHSLETRGTWTNNLRGWRHVVKMRSNRHALPEIRRLAYYIHTALSDVTPLYFCDLEVETVDGLPEYT